MFTQTQLINSNEYKTWIGKNIPFLIQPLYETDNTAFIVILEKNNKFDVCRFFYCIFSEKIYVSFDYTNITTKELLEAIFNDYTEKLN